MTDYRVYRFDGGSRIELAEWVDAADDDDAVRKAHELGKRSAKCELWQGKRLVLSLSNDFAQ